MKVGNNIARHVKFDENITINVNEFESIYFMFFYICPKDDYNCTFNQEKKDDLFDYNFFVYYSTKIVDFDDPDSPVIDAIFKENCTFSVKNFLGIIPFWEVFFYEEMKGIISRVSDSFLKKQNKYIFGRFKEKVFTYNTLNYG